MTTLHILFGSATGNAEQIAKGLATKPPPAGFEKVVCEPMEKFKKLSAAWSNPPPTGRAKHGMILIASTTGNGDPPENASRFVRYLKRKTTVEEQPFKHVAFATLGLGDTNYDQFCQTGRVVDKKMSELGGTRAKPLACADEATGLEDVVEPWEASVFADIANACAGGSGDSTKKNAEKASSEKEQKSLEQPAKVAVSPAPSKAVSGPAKTAPVKTTIATKSDSPLFILYGSATGNAEQIAKDLASTYEMILKNPDAQTYFPSVICCELDEYKKKCASYWEVEPSIKGTTHGIIVVSSTTGNGDPPENANRFTRYCKRKTTITSQPFRHCSFAVLGLGDTNYDQFCGAAKIVDKKMHELGGVRVKPLACADEATGLEDVVDAWTNSILSEITAFCRTSTAVMPEESKVSEEAEVTSETKSETMNFNQEEKKNEDSEIATPSVKSPIATSVGVEIIRSILSLNNEISIPKVKQDDLPTLGSARSTCEFIHENSSTDASSQSKDSATNSDDVSVASDSSEYFTMSNPFEASISAARYLTATDTTAAAQVCEVVGPTGLTSDKELLESREIIDKAFPLLEDISASVSSSAVVRNGKRVIEMTVSLPSDGTFKYQPGDSIGLIVDNTPEAVTFVLSMLRDQHGINSSQRISVDSCEPLTVEETVRTRFDLCTPIKNRRILHSLSHIATNQDEIDTLRLLASKTKDGEVAFQAYVITQRKTIVDILKDFPSCQSISLDGLFSMLSSIPPRYYSVSSSPIANSGSERCLTVAFSLVDYLTPSLVVEGRELGQNRVYGVATRYLEALCSGLLSNKTSSAIWPTRKLKIFPKTTEHFLLPRNLSTPMILIGPGTGIAPFIGYLQHRQAQRAAGDASSEELGSVEVFFGCRHSDHDWLFKEELENLKTNGIISNLHTAFSRDDPSKRQYVQDLMRNEPACASRIVDLIMNKQGAIYICGDGNKMAKDVQATIAGLVCKQLDAGEDAGKAYLEQMKTEGRLLLDIWS